MIKCEACQAFYHFFANRLKIDDTKSECLIIGREFMIGWWGGGGARDLSKFRYASLS